LTPESLTTPAHYCCRRHDVAEVAGTPIVGGPPSLMRRVSDGAARWSSHSPD
jgi:hypothetical protein